MKKEIQFTKDAIGLEEHIPIIILALDFFTLYPLEPYLHLKK